MHETSFLDIFASTRTKTTEETIESPASAGTMTAGETSTSEDLQTTWDPWWNYPWHMKRFSKSKH